MMKKNIVKEKSLQFALHIIGLSRELDQRKEYILSRQLMRSGTAIGALIRESEHAESKKDFIHKLNIALKEANETAYWLELLHQSQTIDQKEYSLITNENNELLSLLIRIIKTTKANLNTQ